MSRKNTRILVVDDEEIVRESLAGWLEKDGYHLEAAEDGPTALGQLAAGSWDILLVDLKMPGMDGLEVLARAKEMKPEVAVVIMTAYATVDTAVSAIKTGAWDYLTKPFDPEELSMMIERIVSEQSLRRENRMLRRALRREHTFHDLVSQSEAMRPVFELARAAARTTSTVLVTGESGTGKELVARAIHGAGVRANGPFVAVSCAALTETLLESELFGHERGSFTGATGRREGKFEAAKGGTVFLDEIGDVSSKLQLDLLRVLEEHAVTRIGGNATIPVDARVLAATNRDLRHEVEEGRFRQDLYYRLAVVTIVIPPLRRRKEDIPLLVDHLLGRLSVELGRPVEGVASDAMARLLAHDWPGNVRELRNVLERALVVSAGPLLLPEHLALEPAASAPAGLPSGPPPTLEQVERHHVEEVLRWTGGNVRQAARVLEIDRATLYAKMKKWGIRRDDRTEEAEPVEARGR